LKELQRHYEAKALNVGSFEELLEVKGALQGARDLARKLKGLDDG
jgi:hypothetical protein